MIVTSSSSLFVLYARLKRQNAMMGELFVAGHDALGFRKLVSNVVFNEPRAAFDLYAVRAFRGLFLVNRYTQLSLINIKKQKIFVNGQDFIQTQISLDGSDSFRNLVPPRLDCDGAAFHFDELTALHLHIHSHQDIEGIYSIRQSPGLLLSHGNVGHFLDFNP